MWGGCVCVWGGGGRGVDRRDSSPESVIALSFDMVFFCKYYSTPLCRIGSTSSCSLCLSHSTRS